MNLLLNSVLLFATQGEISQTDAPVSTPPVEAAASGLGWSFFVVIAAVLCIAAAIAMFFITLRKEESQSNNSETDEVKKTLEKINEEVKKTLKEEIKEAVKNLTNQNKSDGQQTNPQEELLKGVQAQHLANQNKSDGQQTNPQEELRKSVQAQLETIISQTSQLPGIQNQLGSIESKVLAPEIIKQMKAKGIPTDLAQIEAVFGFANGFKVHYAMQSEDWKILIPQLMGKINADMDKTALNEQVKDLNGQVKNLTQEKETLSGEKTNLQDAKSSLEQKIQKLEKGKAESDEKVKQQEEDFQNQLTEKQTAMQQLKDDHYAAEQKLKDEQKATEEKLKAEKKETEEKFKSVFDTLVSPDVQKLFGIDINQKIDTSVLRPMYSYLCLLAELRTTVFATRFGVFDKDLRSSFEGSELAAIRQKIEEDLNPRIKDAEYKIHWPAVGERYDEEIHRSESDYGQSIREVKTAVIYRLKDGEFQRESKANVVTG